MRFKESRRNDKSFLQTSLNKLKQLRNLFWAIKERKTLLFSLKTWSNDYWLLKVFAVPFIFMALLWIASVNGHAFIALSSEWIKQFVEVFFSSQFSVWKLLQKGRKCEGVVEVFQHLSKGIKFHLSARVVWMWFKKNFLSTKSTLIESIKVFLYLRRWLLFSLQLFSCVRFVYLESKQQQIVHNRFMFMFYSLGYYLFSVLRLPFKRLKKTIIFSFKRVISQ